MLACTFVRRRVCCFLSDESHHLFVQAGVLDERECFGERCGHGPLSLGQHEMHEVDDVGDHRFVRHVMQWYAVPVEFDVTGGDRMCFVGVSARAGRCDDGCASEGVDAEHYRLLTVSRAVVSDSDETGCTCA